MRIIYQSGELKLSLTKKEIKHIVDNSGSPVTMDIKMLKVLHEDISDCVKAHWSNVEVWQAIEEHLASQKSISKKNENNSNTWSSGHGKPSFGALTL